MAGSAAPLARKLGITEHARVLLVGAPAGFDLGELPSDVLLTSALPGTADPGSGEPLWDVILAFCPDRATLERAFPALRSRLALEGGLWVAWPTPAGGLSSDLDGEGVRAIGAACGLLDTEVCGVTDRWSALRFATRLQDRPPRPGP